MTVVAAASLSPSQLGTAVHSLLEISLKARRNPYDYVGRTVVCQWKDDEHALFSPSGSHRWLACPGFLLLAKKFPSEPQPQLTVKVDKSMANSAEYGYDAVIPTFQAAKHFGAETRVTVPVTGEFGTVDAWALLDGCLDVTDYKNGRHRVLPTKNSQMRIYAHGLLHKLKLHKSKMPLRLRIIQPNAMDGGDVVNQWYETAAANAAWIESTVKPVVKSVNEGTAKLITGEHCHMCRFAARCPERTRQAASAAKLDWAEYTMPKKPSTMPLLTDKEVAGSYHHVKMFRKLADHIEAEIMRLVRKNPKLVPDVKVVEGQTRRKWLDEDATIKRLVGAGFKLDNIAPRYLNGLGDIAKLLKPAIREAFMAKHTTKPRGKPCLAPKDDPRPSISSNALLDFADDQEDA